MFLIDQKEPRTIVAVLVDRCSFPTIRDFYEEAFRLLVSPIKYFDINAICPACAEKSQFAISCKTVDSGLVRNKSNRDYFSITLQGAFQNWNPPTVMARHTFCES